MSPGISAARAQVSLNDLYEHPHSTAGNTHTHTLKLPTHKHPREHSKINTADSSLTQARARSSSWPSAL